MNEMNAGGVRQRSVEIVVPVYNEAHVLAGSIGRLHAYLEASFPFPFRITVADNASTDASWESARALADLLPHVHAIRLERKGRGRALKHWLVAVATDQTASSIILESGQPVISMGGWSGSDEAMTLAKLKELVKAGQLHYIVVSNSDSGRSGGTDAASEIAEWVKEHGGAVSDYSDSDLYRLDASDVG